MPNEFGEFTDTEKLKILQYIGKRAVSKFNQNLFFGPGSPYDLHFLMDTLQVEPDVDEFENKYYIDVGDSHGNDLAGYFEYGTGIHNIHSPKMIVPKTQPYMTFEGTFKYRGKIVRAKEVKGVRPVMMYQKTMKWLEQNRFNGENLQEKAVKILGIQ